MSNGQLDPIGAIYELRIEVEALRREIAKERHRFNNFETGHLGEMGKINRMVARITRLESLMFRFMGGATALSALISIFVTAAVLAWRLGLFSGK